jgi:hypothetical protein
MNTSIHTQEVIYKDDTVQVYKVKIYCSFPYDCIGYIRDIKMLEYAAKTQLSYCGFERHSYNDFAYFYFLNSAHALDFAKAEGNLTDKELVHYTLMCI